MPLFALLAGLALGSADTTRLVVVATTDIQGQVTDWDYLQNAPAAGGLARVATVVDSLRARYPGQVIVVDAGGALSGNPLTAYFGREALRDPHPVIDAMNLVGYDAATPGDRDFDFGADRFNGAITAATFPWVSGNLNVLPQDTLAFAPFVVIQRNGVRVAIGGFTTPGAMVWNGPRLRGRFRVDRIEAASGRVLRAMRDNADVAIVLSNSGLGGGSSYDTSGVGAENAAAAFVSGENAPDLVVLGHSRQEIADTVVSGVHFVQPRPEGMSVAIVHLALVAQRGALTVSRVRVERLPLADVRPAPRIVRRLAEPHAAVLRWVSAVVGESRGRFSAATARVEDTPLMRFIHEAQRRATGADLSAAPVLDLRAGIEPGEVTMAELFRLAPAEWNIRAVRINGDQLRAYLEQSARYFFVDSAGRVFTNRYAPADRYDVVGGASYTIDLSQRAGSRITQLAVRGRAVAPTDSFTLALPENRQLGQGGYAMLAQAPVVFDKPVTLRQALVTELARRKVIRLEDFQGRDWSLAPADLARKARALFVRDAAPEQAAEAVSDSASLASLPLRRTRADLLTQDSIDRARQREEAAAAKPVATLRLPAETGLGGGLSRLLADAYRNAQRTDVAVVLPAEGSGRLAAQGLSASEIEAAVTRDATLLTIHMSGEDLRALLENVVAQDGPCCELSGVVVRYNPKAKPWDRVVDTRLVTTGKPIDRKATYLVAISTRLLDGSRFSLGATDCRPGQGCKTPGDLSRWSVERSDRRPADVLREYLRNLPQPVTPPDDARLVPAR